MILRHPLVLAGLALLAIPLLVHLLVRGPATTIELPSLRFVRPSRMRALRRRLIDDPGLLVLRGLIVAVAVVALADPLMVAGCRGWDARTIRSVIVLDGAAPRGADDGLAAGERIDTTDLRDGLRRAVTRLAAAPPGRREIVIVARVPPGSVDARMLAVVPAHVGLRFVPAPPAGVAEPRPGPAWTTSAGGGTFARLPTTTTLSTSATALAAASAVASPVAIETNGDALVLPAFGLRIEPAPAGADDVVAPAAGVRAAVQAVLATGVAVDHSEAARHRMQAQPIVLRVGRRDVDAGAPQVAWMADVVRALVVDADLAATAAGAAASGEPRSQPAGAVVVARDRAGVPIVTASALSGSPAALAVDVRTGSTSPLMPVVVRRVLASRLPASDVSAADPLSISAAQLDAWSRPPGPLPALDLPPAWSDRRWAWSLVLVALGLEWWWRRRRTRASGSAAVDGSGAGGGERAA